MVIVFGISWLPHHVIHLWAEFGDFPLTQASFIFRITAHCLAYSNSSVNPIIYAFLSENFRKAYKQVFKCQIGNSSSSNDVKESKSKIDTPQSTNSTHVWTTINVLICNAGFSFEWTCKIFKSTSLCWPLWFSLFKFCVCQWLVKKTTSARRYYNVMLLDISSKEEGLLKTYARKVSMTCV